MMTTQIGASDPWAMTIGLLGQLSGTRRADCGTPVATLRKSGRQSAARAPVAAVTVRVLERSTATRVTLAWRDLSRCAYGDQEWYLTRARRSGFCAVSGKAIQRGEAVYRPRVTRPQPLNADAMIHTAVLQDDQQGS
jgi:hypothetical protein